MKGLFGRHIQLTARVMDIRLERQNLVMGNIANVNTPDYKARRLEFEEKLQGALNQNAHGKMTRTSEQHLPGSFNVNSFSGEGLKDFKPRHIHGEDAVDLDKEMTISTKNGMMYNALAQVIQKNFTGMKQYIQEASK